MSGILYRTASLLTLVPTSHLVLVLLIHYLIMAHKNITTVLNVLNVTVCIGRSTSAVKVKVEIIP